MKINYSIYGLFTAISIAVFVLISSYSEQGSLSQLTAQLSYTATLIAVAGTIMAIILLKTYITSKTLSDTNYSYGQKDFFITEIVDEVVKIGFITQTIINTVGFIILIFATPLTISMMTPIMLKGAVQIVMFIIPTIHILVIGYKTKTGLVRLTRSKKIKKQTS